MKKVITYGTFDLFHYGHLRLLQRAKKKGDHLTVAISSDAFNDLKDKKSVIPFKARKEIIKSLDMVDKVITEKNWEQKRLDIEEHNIDILVMGDDWKGKFDDLSCSVVYLPRTKDVSTTKIKDKICKL